MTTTDTLLVEINACQMVGCPATTLSVSGLDGLGYRVGGDCKITRSLRVLTLGHPAISKASQGLKRLCLHNTDYEDARAWVEELDAANTPELQEAWWNDHLSRHYRNALVKTPPSRTSSRLFDLGVTTLLELYSISEKWPGVGPVTVCHRNQVLAAAFLPLELPEPWKSRRVLPPSRCSA